MFLSLKYKMIFIHVPKSGGSSFENTISMLDPGGSMLFKPHLRASEAKWVLEGQWMDWLRVGIVRHPCELLLSHYRAILRIPIHSYYGRVVLGNDCLGTPEKPAMGFEEYVRWQTEQRNPIGNCWYYDAPMSVIMRYETIEDDWKKLADRMGVEKPVPEFAKVNFAPGGRGGSRWREDVNESALSYIRDIYSEDFRRFGYSI